MTAADGIRIRPATPADAAAVHAMIRRLAADIPSHHELRSSGEDFVAAMAGDAPAIRAFVAERDAQFVGTLVFFTTFSTWYGTPGVYVQDIYVDERLRGTGLGRRLLAAAQRWGAQHGANHMRLSVSRENVAAQHFYAHCGFEHCDDERIYMIEGEAFDALGTEE